MKKAFIIITSIFLFGFKPSDKKVIASYISAPNDIAHIKLTLFDNYTFKFKMEMLGFNSKINSAGIWKENGNTYRLAYKTEKPNLNSLFDESYDANNDFEVIDENIVDIISQKNELWILGINCQKKEFTNSIKTNPINNSTEKSIEIKQFKAILYKANQWLDVKGKGSLAAAMENPTKEKVEIIQTEKNFKVTFGNSDYIYKIISKRIFSEMITLYDVTLNEVKYEIAISKLPNGTVSVNIDGIWQVLDIKNSSIFIEENTSNKY